MKLAIPNQNTKYAVGIDFGHGETSFAYCAFAWNNTQSQLSNPTDIRTEGNSIWTLPSVYSIDKESGNMHIGSSGVENIQYSKDNFKISFKKRPSLMSADEKKKYTEFMQQVHILMKRNSSEFQSNEYVVYICRPSGWNTKEDELYLEMAYNAGIPVAGIFPESRAAMINNSLNANLQMIDINKLHEGSILIDLGSSTVDLTYMDEKMNFPIDDNGNDYGAQIVDNILFEYVLSLPGNELAKKMIEDKVWIKDVLLFECRKAKETFFRQRQYFTLNIPLSNYCSDDEDYANGFFRCKREYGEKDAIYKLIENGLAQINKRVESGKLSQTVCEAINTGYYTKLKTCLKEFVGKLSGKQIKCIVLTGGASFMFLEEGFTTFRNKILKDIVPNYSSISILIDPNPSTTVSRGISQVGRSYARFAGCEGYEGLEKRIIRNINEQIERFYGFTSHSTSYNSVEDIFHNLISRVKNVVSISTKVASSITDAIMSDIDSVMSDFKYGHITTIDALKSRLEGRIKSTTSNIGDIINRDFEKITKEQLEITRNQIKEIVKLYTTKEPVLPEISKKVHIDQISVNTNGLDSVISTLSANLGLQILVFVLYTVMYIVYYPIYLFSRYVNPFGTTKSYDDWFDDTFGDPDLDSDLYTKTISDSNRKKAYEKYIEEKSSIRSKVYSEICTALDNNQFTSKANTALVSNIRQYAEDSIAVVKRIFK